MAVQLAKLRFESRIPGSMWLTFGVLCVLGFFSANPELSVAAVLLLFLFFLLLWRPGEPLVLLFALIFQWAQAVTKVIHANVLGMQVQELSAYGGNVELASWLSIGALAALASGVWLALRGVRHPDPSLAQSQAHLLSVRRLWLLYLLALPVSILILTMAWAIPGGTQAGLALADMRWAIFFCLAYVCLVKGQYSYLLLAAFAIEFMIGIGGYFAEFKTVFIVFGIAYVTSGRRLVPRQIGVIAALASGLLLLSLVWTSIKTEYRDYLNEGQMAQIVTRGYFERTEKLFEMVSDLRAEDLEEAVGNLVARIAYVDFFGLVTTSVPHRIEHQEGDLWTEAVTHILLPRLLFPNKPPLPSDSEMTRLYTGLYVAGDETGTSVSIGYAAESYIDFGRYGMFVPIFLLGILWGLIYRFFITRRQIPAFMAYGLAVVVLFHTYKFETGATKLLGGILTSFLVAYVLQRFLVRRLARWLVVGRGNGHDKSI